MSEAVRDDYAELAAEFGERLTAIETTAQQL